jgi:transposase
MVNTYRYFLSVFRKTMNPQLKAHPVVVLDNVSFHHPVDLREKSESTEAKILYLPPYSPEYSPIENMWSNIKKR